MHERDHSEVGDGQHRGEDLPALQRARAVDEHHVVGPQLAQPREHPRVHLVREVEPRVEHPAGHLRRGALRVDVDHQGAAVGVGRHRGEREGQRGLADAALLVRDRHYPRTGNSRLSDRRRGRGIYRCHTCCPFSLVGRAGRERPRSYARALAVPGYDTPDLAKSGTNRF